MAEEVNAVKQANNEFKDELIEVDKKVASEVVADFSKQNIDTKKEVENKRIKAKQPESKMESMQGVKQSGTPIVIKNGDTWYILPATLRLVPKVLKMLDQISDIETAYTEEKLQIFADILLIGIKKNHPEITKDYIMDNVSLGDMPKLLDVIMDLNDFFVGMRKVSLKQIHALTSIQAMSNLTKGSSAQTSTPT